MSALPNTRPLPVSDVPGRGSRCWRPPAIAKPRSGFFWSSKWGSATLQWSSCRAAQLGRRWSRLRTPDIRFRYRRHGRIFRLLFAALPVRTLVLHGTTNFPWILAAARKLAETLPDAEIAQLEGQPHSPAPDMLAPRLIRFFG